MENLLFLAHRIPYPPNKGDKIRSYHFLKHLAGRYRVFLGTFIDDPADRQHTAQTDALCAGTCYHDLNRSWAKAKSLKGLLTGQALSVPYYQSPALQAWVRDTIARHNIKKVLVFSGAMAQFVEHWDPLDVVVDFVDVDSDKWRQYAEKKHGLARWVYAREAKKLLAFEQSIAQKANRSLFVSAQEADLFRRLAAVESGKIDSVNNGVDTDYFDPGQVFACPFPARERAIVFTGAMDYWANADAVVWFARQVMPLLWQRCSGATFYIVGGKPTQEVRQLADNPRITVTGAVPDVRPYLAHAHFAVAPLRIARGIQNKVLEAMAMAKQVLATPAAMEGIGHDGSLAVSVSDQAEQWAGIMADWLAQDHLPAAQNRAFIQSYFSWQENVRRLCGFLDGP